jgi:hypothetical protein
VKMRIGIMQPYFFPYIGYFQLIAAVDSFVVYDNIKYTKKGWINRNRIQQNGATQWITLPLKAGSDALEIQSRQLAESFQVKKLLDQITGVYRAAPFFSQAMPVIADSLQTSERNLFGVIYKTIENVCEYLEIKTALLRSSSVNANHALRSEDRVISICKALDATVYINSIGGVDLYSRYAFQERDIQLQFIESLPMAYEQDSHPFIPYLSIVDVMMFNPVNWIRDALGSGYRLT